MLQQFRAAASFSSLVQEFRVTRSARYRILAVAIAAMCAVQPLLAADGGAVAHQPETPSAIVIGFVGGLVRHDNPHHGPVVFARQLRTTAPKDAYIQVFENRHRRAAFQTIIRLLDRDHDGVLSADEKAQARIILYGHSWGASAAVLLARELNRSGIPVLLTVQVDSVAKLWQKDDVIPANVSAAVNFYQPHGIIHGRQQITAADPARTQILGNFRTDYRQHPVRCEGYTWADRFFTPGHMQSECDPSLWSQVQELVLGRLAPEPSAVAAISGR
jgi:pimeloyl-ACP methyl ester carboxylesterase